MRIAHFSDLHLGARGSTVPRAAALLDRAIEEGAEHLLIGGDVVDHGNLDDAERLLEAFARRGFEGPEKITAVPGNHDIWPAGEENLTRHLANWAAEELRALLSGDDHVAQQRYLKFQRLFPVESPGATAMTTGDAYPAVKEIGPAMVGLFDTTANRALRHSEGRFPEAEADWTFRQMKQWRGPRILLMHHWPFEWAVWDIDAELQDLSTFKRLALRALLIAAQRDEADLRNVFDVNFRRLEEVQAALESSPLDLVLCGHLHMHGSVRAKAFDRKLGDVRVCCMGRSGGIHQGADVEHAFHLIDVGPKSVTVKTVYVERKALAAQRRESQGTRHRAASRPRRLLS
ncbi:MAG TPA: metallophosphoesterase [Anaeromyxobacteraceae bacterium]|jgi:3',5'-cyclic AMP phosphodiesterase CpdA|nr:metallophosphoesterase [Anaeromyxobacteraceae bacterium]